MTVAAPPRFEVVRIPYIAGESPCGPRNRALARARAEWVLLLDSDAAPAVGCLERLEEAVRRHPRAAAFVPRVVFADRPDLIHSDAGLCHFLGEPGIPNAHAPAGGAVPPPDSPTCAKATALLLRRDAVLAGGGFDRDFTFYREDTDLTLRLAAEGGVVVPVPDAVVLHVRRPRPAGDLREEKTYLMARNRWRLILKVFDLRTLLLTAPFQVLYEALSFARSASRGEGLRHAAALRDAALDLPATLAARRAFLARKRLRDRDLLDAPPLAWTPDALARPGAPALKAAVDAACRAWWRAILPALR